MKIERDPIGIPADPKQWTEAECDEALRRIVDHDLAIAAARSKHDHRVARAKAAFDEIRQQHAGGKKSWVALLRTAARRLKKAWPNQSHKLFWGTIAFRHGPAKLDFAPGASEQSVIDAVREHDVQNGIRIIEALNLEVLERLDADTLTVLGLRWSNPKEVFSYKTKLEIDAEESGKGSPR